MLVRFCTGYRAGGRGGSELTQHLSLAQTIEPLWTIARYNLGLSTEEFYSLTPRQFHLLNEAHRKSLVHREMIQAYTTAAIINYSLGAPETPAQPVDFIPHYQRPASEASTKPVKLTEGELQDWNTRVMNLAAELKQGHGPMLDAMKEKANG